MGQKVHPHGLRVGFYRKWNTTWFAEKNKYKSLFFAQHQLEHFLKAFFHLYSYTKNSAAKKIALVDLKWFRSGSSQLYFFVFFYKFRTRKRRWGISRFRKKKFSSRNLSIKRSFSDEEGILKRNLRFLERSKLFQKNKINNLKKLEVNIKNKSQNYLLKYKTLNSTFINVHNWYKTQQYVLYHNKFLNAKKVSQLLYLRKKVYQVLKEEELLKVKKNTETSQIHKLI